MTELCVSQFNCKATVALLIFYCTAMFCSAQTTMNEIWLAVWNKSPEIRTSGQQLEASKLQEKLAHSAYIPTVSLGGSGKQAVLAPTEDGEWNGDWAATLSMQQASVGGTSWSLDLGCNVSDLAFLAGSSKLIYPSVAVNVQQRLYPFWKYSGRFDTALESAKLISRQSGVTLAKTRRDLAIQAAEVFISLRRLEREKAYLEISIETLKKELEAKMKLQLDGALTITEVWKSENFVWRERQKFLQALSAADEYREKLFILSGKTVKDSIGSNLPVMAELGVSKLSPEEEDLELRAALERQNLLAQMQEASPLLDLRITRNLVYRQDGWTQSQEDLFPSRPNDTWNFQVNLVFPTSFFGSMQLRKKLAESNMVEFANQAADQRTRIGSQKRLLELRLEGLLTQSDNLKTEKWRTDRMVADAEEMKKQGSISELQFLQIKLTYQQIAADMENIQDQIWLLQLYLAAF